MCLAIMACAVCRKKVLMRNLLNVLVGFYWILLDFMGCLVMLGDFAKVSGRLKKWVDLMRFLLINC